MRKKWLSKRQLLLPYTDFVRRVRVYSWESAPVGELRERLGRDCGTEERYSLLAEAVFRLEGVRLFDTQLSAARAMEEGNVVQLATGEGKTLAAVAAAASLALQGKSVHILVFNDYLARRDFQAHRDVFRFCGLTTGLIESTTKAADRRRAYGCSVLYTTAREAGFDYLKNFLCMTREEQLAIPFQCALVDEADSVLIDEARIPLVVAGPTPEAEERWERDIRRLAGELSEAHWETDGSGRRVWLTDEGIAAVEETLGLENLFAPENGGALARVSAALEAEHLLIRGRDYLVRGGEVRLIDGLTGRVAGGRRYPDLLHRAVEEKEGILQGRHTVLLNSMPLQFFLLQYDLLAGMTGTAEGCQGELQSMYSVKTVVVPSRAPCLRRDWEDTVFLKESEKEAAVVKCVTAACEKGQPVLIGTQSVAESEKYAGLLREAKIVCRLLNAERDEEEASVIAEAGGPGRVTVSTNMAGRGVDIRLGGAEGADLEDRERVVRAGGLLVIGCGLNVNSRVDRQLRGRAGRQGEPGESRFFISLDEPIFTKNRGGKAWDRIARGLNKPGWTREVQRALEGEGAEARYMLERYAFIQEEHRRRITRYRDVLLGEEAAPEFLRQDNSALYEEAVRLYGKGGVEKAERRLTLYFISRRWSDYLMSMENVRTGIHLTVIGGIDPLDQYNRIAAGAFAEMQADIRRDVTEGMRELPFTAEGIDLEAHGLSGSTETWTYMIDEGPGQFARPPKVFGNANIDRGSRIKFFWR